MNATRAPARRRGLLIVGVLVVLSGCGSAGEGLGDASAELACTHFRDVASDAADGLLTNAELRGKLQEVYNDAKYSDSPGIAEGAERMVRDVTQGDTADMKAAIPAFDQACTDAGF